LSRTSLRRSDAGTTRQEDLCLALGIRERGTLENLALEWAPRRPPGSGEVEIRVAASSLNFRDVLNALGMYPGDPGPLGNEVSGTISAVGAQVDDLAVGDEVVALCDGGFATHVTTSAALVVSKPSALPADVAASTPIAFLTALYGLRDLAGMRAGDKVLVHAAAGGVGLAAVQLAQAAGAEVFATAGSDAKRELLRSLGVVHVMDSRSTEFAAEIGRLTGGRGVDIVLNSLTGDFIPKSLESLGRDGRFVEIGKKGIWDAARVAAVRPDVAYHVLFLGDLFTAQPELTRRMLQEVLGSLEAGALRPLPLTRFPLERAVEAFRYMAQARHTGKIVLLPPPFAASPSPTGSAAVRPDATYLVTGGLGALGLHAARALVERGARSVALAGRREPGEAARQVIAELEGAGARVTVVAADVAEAGDVERLFARLEELPALAGIVHAAGVVDDGVIEQQTWDRLRKVLAPKVTGAWRLHAATAGRPLDFLVFYSSVASQLGSPGQAGYAAANAFLDGLAHARRAAGLPALSVNWGGWSGGGMTASLEQRDRDRWRRLGFSEIEPGTGMNLLFRMIETAPPQLMVVPAEWSTYVGRFGAEGRPARLDLLQEGRSDRTGGPARRSDAATSRTAADLLDTLASTPPTQRLPVLLTCVRREAATVLGLPGPAKLDVRRGLRDAGLDSLMAVELRNRLQVAVGRALPATVAFDHPTVEELARHLAVGVLGIDLSAPGLDDDRAGGGRAADAVQELSDEEAEAQLNAELAALDRSRGEGGNA